MSEIRANTVSNAAGTGPVTLTGQYAAKVWVNWNGTGTVAVRDSANVSSITDNGTGTYTVNFTSALADANFSAQYSANRDATGNYGYATALPYNQVPTSSSIRTAISNPSVFVDSDYNFVTVHR